MDNKVKDEADAKWKNEMTVNFALEIYKSAMAQMLANQNAAYAVTPTDMEDVFDRAFAASKLMVKKLEETVM